MAKAKPPEMPAKGLFYDPARRGYAAVYRENELNHCPGCGRTHWHIGRTTAEWVLQLVDADEIIVNEKRVLSTELVVRGSSRRCR